MTNERPENVWAATLPNGLRVRVLCKPDFQRSYAVFATCYGGADRRFRVNDTWTDTPAGVAHYLEHKLFDMPDGSDALLTLGEQLGKYDAQIQRRALDTCIETLQAAAAQMQADTTQRGKLFCGLGATLGLLAAVALF